MRTIQDYLILLTFKLPNFNFLDKLRKTEKNAPNINTCTSPVNPTMLLKEQQKLTNFLNSVLFHLLVEF